MTKQVSTYVWEIPVRLCHWLIFISIIVLSITGLYIGSPVTFSHAHSRFFMGWTRFVHFAFAFLFTISVIIRIYWAFVGNRYASWREFAPYLTEKGRRNMKETFLFYTFIRKDPPHVTGHNALAGMAYSAVFFLYLVMILTGFALFSEYSPHSFMHAAFGWMFSIASNQGLRLTHHMVMWLLIGFAVHHVYSAWLMDVKERNGGISSIFGGCKSIPEKEQ